MSDELILLGYYNINEFIDSLSNDSKNKLREYVLSDLINMTDTDFNTFTKDNIDNITLLNQRLRAKMRKFTLRSTLIELKEKCQRPDYGMTVYGRYILDPEDILSMEYCWDNFITCDYGMCDSCQQIIDDLKEKL